MADWYGSARSNYFRVKDDAAFRAWANEYGVEFAVKGDTFAIFPYNTDGGDWPTRYDDNGDPCSEGIAEELQPFLADGEVALLFTIGAENLRYLTAYIAAVTPTSIEYLNLERLAHEKYPTATLCSY